MEDSKSMPQNGGHQENGRMETNSSGQAIHHQISSTDQLLIRICENLDATNGIQQGATPNITSTSNSEITPESNNSAGTSQGQSSNPNEHLETKRSTSFSLAITVYQGAAPNITSDQEDLGSGNDAGNRPLNEYLPLLRAALKGDWLNAKAFHDNGHQECVQAFITTDNATALHIAVGAHHTDFIKKWLTLMSPENLVLQTNNGFTALHFAAQVGNVSIAEQLVEKNNGLPSIIDEEGDTPLSVAAYVGHTNMVSCLFSLSSTSFEQLTPKKRIELLHNTIRNDMYDIALKIMEKDPNIANACTECRWEALKMLAVKPFAIGSESQLAFWKSLLKYSCFKGAYNKALMKTLAHRELVEKLLKKDGIEDDLSSPNLVEKTMALIFEAVKVGNVEFLIILSRSYPSLIFKLDKNNMSIFHIAILHRQESVFNLIYELGASMHSLATYATKDNRENMLHLAGKLAPSDRINIVSGAALQMQRELLWFKEIEKIVPRSYMERKNLGEKTPKDIFVEDHKDLQRDGEKWMKDTANYCMIVATLIATVMFAAAFTVPGGCDQNNGTPILLKKKSFVVFVISDAISLCSASTSIVTFLSILTSRYTENDFLRSLPSKLLFGLATLFISILVMMVAFIATFFLVYTRGRAWIAYVVIPLACIPIIWFGLQHCKIWVDTFRSTYKCRFLFRPHKHRLF